MDEMFSLILDSGDTSWEESYTFDEDIPAGPACWTGLKEPTSYYFNGQEVSCSTYLRLTKDLSQKDNDSYSSGSDDDFE